MNEGYVVFVNDDPKYLKLCDILVESVLQFSKKSIEVFAINFDYIHSNKRVISNRISLDTVNFETICYSKIFSTINSSFDYGIQLDADFIITKNMDKLFDTIKNTKEYPICSLHTLDPNNQSNIMDLLDVKTKSQPYVHATYLFSKESKDFFRECYEFSQYCLKNRIIPGNYDETIINTHLWKHNRTDSWIYPYDIWYETFLEPKNRLGYPIDYDLQFFSCHGCKDPVLAEKILNDLINKEQ